MTGIPSVLAQSIAVGVVPGFAEMVRAQADAEQAMVELAVMVARRNDPQAYFDELERRWKFAVERARGSADAWVRADKASMIRSMTREIAAGLL